MSKYTTEVRFICEEANGLDVSEGYKSVNEIIAGAIPKVFDFDYPIFDESYRNVLNTKILKHYYTREIGEETVGLWKLRLETRLNEIMPYYNQLYKSELLEFNPLYTINYTKHGNSQGSEGRNENETKNYNETNTNTANNSKTNAITENGTKDTTNNIKTNEENTQITDTTTTDKYTGKDTVTKNTAHTNAYSDTPQGSIRNVENNQYLTNYRKEADTGKDITDKEFDDNTTVSGTVRDINVKDTYDNGDEKYNKSVNGNETGNLTENKNKYGNESRDNTASINTTDSYLESVSGYQGNNASELLLKYRETFLNIDMMIINELGDLFFNLW